MRLWWRVEPGAGGINFWRFSMGTVIDFPIREPRAPVASEEPRAPGELLLFTGVRYARLEPASVRHCGARAAVPRGGDEDATA